MSARALIEAGYQVSMLTLLDNEPIEVAGQSIRFACGSRLKFLAYRNAMLLTHSHVIYDLAGLGRLTPPGFRRPTAVWIHGEEVWDKLNPGAKGVIERSDLVLANSNFTLMRFRQMHGTALPQARVCWLATEASDSQLGTDFAGPPTVIMLGRLAIGEAGKGHVELIDCWPEVVTRVPEARLLIVGKGENLQILRARANAGPVGSNITFTGFVPEEQIDGIWSKAWVMALPSRQEGFGLVYIEAMSHAAPSIASTLDAGLEVNADGISGFNVNPQNSAELVDRLVKLLSDQAFCRQMGQGGLERWRKHFQYPHFRNRFLADIRSFLGSKA